MSRSTRSIVALAAVASLAVGGASAAMARPMGDSSSVTVITSLPKSGNKTVSVPGGNSVKFSITSNASTGYAYTVSSSKNTAESKVSKVTYVAAQTDLMGAPGTSVVTVKPRHAGSTKVTFTLTSPAGAVAQRSSVTLNFMAD